MTLFTASFDQILIRYYLLMVFAIVPFFLGVPILALLSVPFFLSALLGISFSKETEGESESATSQLETTNQWRYLESA